MRKRLISVIALAAVTMSGAFSAHAIVSETPNRPEMDVAANPDYVTATEKHNRQLAAYQKDMAAYEADPSTWTVEVLRMPAKPEVPETSGVKAEG